MFEHRVKNLVLLSAILLLSFNQICGIRVLGIFPHTGKSHIFAFIPLLKELANRGHQVTVVSHFPMDDPPKNYGDISLKGSLQLWNSSFNFEEFNFPFGAERIIRHVVIMQKMFEFGTQSCEAMVKNKEVQNLKEGQFDLAIIEQFNSDCGLGIIHKLKLPFIGITSHYILPWTENRLGMIFNPSHVPNHFLPYGINPGMFETIESMLISTWYKTCFYIFSQIPERRLLLDHYDKNTPPLEDIARRMSMVMINTYFPLAGAAHFAPNIVEIGGMHLQKKRPIDQEFETYINNSKNGVIVLSMGSMLRGDSWPEEKLKSLQDAFNELSMYDVLWKWESDTMRNKPKNVRLVKWLPQFEILNHKKVKVFITHAGMMGLSEAVHCGVPVVCIPIFGDQFTNAAMARDRGIGEYLVYKKITKDTVLQAIRHMLEPKVQKRSEKISEIWKDRPISVLDNAVYWVEHIAKYGGDHLRPSSADLPLYRYLLLDVIVFILFVLFVMFYINYLCCVTLCRRRSAKKSKKD